MRIDRIVVGVDFSPPSNAAVDWAARIFPAAELTLVHCVAPPHVPTFLARHAAARTRTLELAREGAMDRLATLGHSLGSVKVRTEVRTEVRDGAPVEGIVAAARAHTADLVVLATTGERIGGERHGRLGRTAEQVARASPAPVLLCAGSLRERPRRLLVALDESDITAHVLAWTRHLAERFDAEVAAVHVVSSAVLTHVLAAADADAAADAAAPDRARAGVGADVDRWIDEMVRFGLGPARVTSEVEFGEPAQEIVAAAERRHGDMIVLGSRGAGAVRRALLGSVVSEVLHHAPCPVLVVVDPEDEIEPEDG